MLVSYVPIMYLRYTADCCLPDEVSTTWELFVTHRYTKHQKKPNCDTVIDLFSRRTDNDVYSNLIISINTA